MKSNIFYMLVFILFSAIGFSQQQVLTKTGKLSTLTKVDVGLGNVNNTSDANKPVSTATQTALDAKVSLGGDLAGTGSTAAAPVITDGAISTGKLQDNAVTNAKIAVGAGGIYKGSGSLSGPTVVTQGDNTLKFNTTSGTALFIDGSTNAVGIGTSSPGTSAVLEIASTTKGLLPPRMLQTQMNAIAAPATGLIVVCTDCSPSGVYSYNGTSWGALGASTTVLCNCDADGFVGNFIEGVSLSGASYSVTITNNSFSTVNIAFTAADLVLSGVSGLTVGTPTGSPALTSGTSTLASGASVKVTYPITGTPAGSGSLTGTWTKVALNCSKIQTVLPLASIASLDCAGATNNGSLTAYTTASGVSSILPYTGGNGSGYMAQSITSTGVTGLTATLAAGTLASGSGNVTYTITGTPSGMGTASFAINLGGQACTLTRSVVLPAGVVSTLNCAGATHTGTLPPDTAASGVSSTLPYTGGNGGTYAAQSITSTGVTGLTATLTAGTLAIGAGNLTFTISGTPSGIGTASFAINLGGQACTLTRPVGIFDRAYGLTINGANNHNFVYGTVTGADGKTWLNNNLGAHYANVNHASFNFTKQATSATDYLAYGSLFQWGRAADGHELITWTAANVYTPVNGTTTTLSGTDTPANNLFIINSGGNGDWRNPQNSTLWQGESGTNNPCPVGYRLPTSAELNNLMTTSSITNSATAASSALKFTVAGYRLYSSGSVDYGGSGGFYRSSSVSGVLASTYDYNGSSAYANTSYRAYGLSVRCIKN